MTNNFFNFFSLSTRFVTVAESIIDRDNFSQEAIASPAVKILNWNVAKQNNTPAWTRDFFHILETYQPDLVCLQEISLNTQTKSILALESMGWNFAPNFRDTYTDNYCGILTASPVKPIARTALLTQDCEPLTNTPKVSLIAEYAIAKRDRPLLVVNTHAINFVTSEKFAAQLNKLEQFLHRRSEPIVLCGDFNTWSQRRLRLLNLMGDRLHLTPVQFSPPAQTHLKTFFASPPLDWIYYRGLSQKPASATVFKEITSSDHTPMGVELLL
jgi:endonuclease/exonuclease/phosphatase (EEP) superfamily protein YafD